MEQIEVYNDERTFEDKGITGNISRYVTVNMAFPCLIIENTAEKPVVAYQVKTLQNMLYKGTPVDDDTSFIWVYFRQGERTAKLGKILARQTRVILQLFEHNAVYGCLNKDTLLEGDYIYILAD